MRTLVRRPAGQVLSDIVLIGRPWFWPVSLVPYYVGFVLATHRLVPTGGEWLPLGIGAVVIGPLMWIAVLAVNDAHDLPGDLLNPRKRSTPLTAGRVTPDEARHIAAAAGALAVLTALGVGPAYAVGTAACLALGWAYSAPPLRLKGRAGADVIVNAVAIGAVGPLAGWSVLQSPADFPWVMALQGILVGAALYLPTTLADHDTDRAAGDRTTAVRLGVARTYRLGAAAWSAAAALCVVLAAADLVIPRRMLAMEVIMVPVLVVAYRRFITAEQSFRGIVVVATLFLVPSATFVLTYAGVL